MHFTGFKSKADLKARIKLAVTDPTKAVRFGQHAIETSMFGPEFKGDGTYCVCMDHPKRTKFANLTVRNGLVVKVA